MRGMALSNDMFLFKKYVYTYTLIYQKHILSLHSIAHNIPVHTKLSNLYIHLHLCI